MYFLSKYAYNSNVLPNWKPVIKTAKISWRIALSNVPLEVKAVSKTVLLEIKLQLTSCTVVLINASISDKFIYFCLHLLLFLFYCAAINKFKQGFDHI